MDFILNPIISAAGMTATEFFICTAVAVILGLAIAAVTLYRNSPSKSFLLTLVLLPMCVEIIIMLVNSNIGTGLAVAGTFALIRFRSVPASARDIVTLLVAMVCGFSIGKGYIYIAIIFFIIAAAAIIILSSLKGFDACSGVKMLRVTVPENLEYETCFEDIFKEYTVDHTLEFARTTNMGSLYELKYRVVLKKNISQKEFCDKIRTRNGNLTVGLGTYTLDKKDML